MTEQSYNARAAQDQVNYIVHPTRVTMLVGEDEIIDHDETDLYGDLILAGYPANDDDSMGGYYVDIAVRGEQVIVFTQNPGREWDMGDAAGLFLAWHVRNGLS